MISKKVAAKLAVIVLTIVVVVAGSALAATTTISGTITTNVQVVRSGTAGEAFSTSTNQLVDLPGATVTVTVSPGTRALILARFSAESRCSGDSPADDLCGARVLIGGQAAEPDQVAWGPGSEVLFEARSFEWSRGPLNAGTYQVKVQVRGGSLSGNSPFATFTLAKSTFTVQRILA